MFGKNISRIGLFFFFFLCSVLSLFFFLGGIGVVAVTVVYNGEGWVLCLFLELWGAGENSLQTIFFFWPSHYTGFFDLFIKQVHAIRTPLLLLLHSSLSTKGYNLFFSYKIIILND